MPSSILHRNSKKISIDWGHLLTVMAMAAWALWYLVDVRSVSLNLGNTLLVQPLTIVFLLMLVAVLPQVFQKEDLPEALKPESLDRPSALRILGLMAAFAIFVWGMFAVGFDAAVFVFSFTVLLIGGERRWWLISIFATLSTVILVKGYQLLVPFQMPNILLG